MNAKKHEEWNFSIQLFLDAKMSMSDLQRFPQKLCLIKYELDIDVYDF